VGVVAEAAAEEAEEDECNILDLVHHLLGTSAPNVAKRATGERTAQMRESTKGSEHLLAFP